MEMLDNTLSEKPISNEVNDQIWDIDEPSFDEAFGTESNPDPVLAAIEDTTDTKTETTNMKEELPSLDDEEEAAEKTETPAVDFNPDEVESSENPVLESETKEGETPEEDPENEFSIFAKMLAEKELLDINEEDFEATEDGLIDAFAGTIEARVKEEIDMFQKNLPSEGKELLRHMMAGGSIADFKESYGTPDYENVSIEENENNQKWIIAEFMRLRGDSVEEIQETIEDYADLGKLEKQAAKAQERLAEYSKRQKENLAIKREEEKKAREQKREEVLTNISSLVEESNEIKGFPLTRKAKKDLLTYMTDTSVKIDTPNGPQYVTQYQADEMKASENLEDFVLKAYLRMTDYNLGPVKKKSESNLSAKLRQQLQHSKSKTGTQAKFGGGKKPASSGKAGSDWNL
jgi:hypothetical protein